MMAGVSLGIVVGAVVLALGGAGTWQIVVATAAAFVISAAAGASQMVRNQAAASAILIVALHKPSSNLALQRLEDALIGGAVAVVIARFLLPIDPIPLVRDEARKLRGSSSHRRSTRRRVRSPSGHRTRAENAVERIWKIDDGPLAQALLTAREVTRAAPRRRPMRRRVEKLGELYRELEASVYDSHAIATGVVRLADSDRPPPHEAIAAIQAAAEAMRAIEPDAAAWPRDDAGRREASPRSGLVARGRRPGARRGGRGGPLSAPRAQERRSAGWPHPGSGVRRSSDAMVCDRGHRRRLRPPRRSTTGACSSSR